MLINWMLKRQHSVLFLAKMVEMKSTRKVYTKYRTKKRRLSSDKMKDRSSIEGFIIKNPAGALLPD